MSLIMKISTTQIDKKFSSQVSSDRLFQMYQKCGNRILNEVIKRRFVEKKFSENSPPWQPLKEGWYSRKKISYYGSENLLIGLPGVGHKPGQLRDSIYYKVESGSLWFISPTEYSAFVNDKRKFLGFSGGNRERKIINDCIFRYILNKGGNQ